MMADEQFICFVYKLRQFGTKISGICNRIFMQVFFKVVDDQVFINAL